MTARGPFGEPLRLPTGNPDHDKLFLWVHVGPDGKADYGGKLPADRSSRLPLSGRHGNAPTKN